MKTRKSLVKRFKVTRNGKILRRMTGQDHNRAKKTGARKRAGRKWVTVSPSEIRTIKRFITY